MFAGTIPSALALLGGAALLTLAFSAGRFSADLGAATVADGIAQPTLRPKAGGGERVATGGDGDGDGDGGRGTIGVAPKKPPRPACSNVTHERRAGANGGGGGNDGGNGGPIEAIGPIGNRSLVPSDAGCTVDLYVMFRTRSSSNTVEEVVAFYLAHGARVVLVIDNSPDDAVEKLLGPYVRSRRVIYERDHYFNQAQASETTKAREGGNLREHALTFARLAAVSPRPLWLLSVDDDEFVVPGTQRTDVATLLALLATPGPGKPGVMTATTEDELSKNTHFEANRTLCRHLSDPRTLRWKTLLFRWKWVGSSGLTEMPPGALYTEAFVKMGLKIDRMGKSAYYLNHPDVTLQTWIDQDNLLVSGGGRFGGPFFMHGNNPLLTLRAAGSPPPRLKGVAAGTFPAVVGDRSYTRGWNDVNVEGFCFHFMGTPARFGDHFGLWDGKAHGGRHHGGVAREIDKRDQNNVTWDAVSKWSCSVRQVMALVRGQSATGSASGGGGGGGMQARQTAPRPASHRCLE